MANVNDPKKYVNDSRLACKYGAECYQKNPTHLQKYKHPPPKRINHNATINQPKKKFKLDVDTKGNANITTDNQSSEVRDDKPAAKVDQQERKDDGDVEEVKELKENTDIDKTENENAATAQPNQTLKISIDQKSTELYVEKAEDKTKKEIKAQEKNVVKDKVEKVPDLGRTPENFSPEEFIKEKFLVDMPQDFHQFWEFCKSLKAKSPQEALRDVGLALVGPYDVLAGKFYDVAEQPSDNYLIHWRYYYDPPECQTVLRGDDRTGYHIGYYRDSPKELPVFLVSNLGKTDGIFKVIGDNIFAAVYLYLEDLKKTGDPFKKMHIGRFQNAIRKKTEELQLSLTRETKKNKDRDKKIVTRSFSKIGIVVPYNRKTQVGYRDLGVTNKELVKLLDNIQNATPDRKLKYISVLQDILTNVTIATDECDFGTGIEFGLNILAHGVNSLNQTISSCLATNYKLINKEEFARISEAHMKNRKQGTSLSIV